MSLRQALAADGVEILVFTIFTMCANTPTFAAAKFLVNLLATQENNGDSDSQECTPQAESDSAALDASAVARQTVEVSPPANHYLFPPSFGPFALNPGLFKIPPFEPNNFSPLDKQIVSSQVVKHLLDSSQKF